MEQEQLRTQSFNRQRKTKRQIRAASQNNTTDNFYSIEKAQMMYLKTLIFFNPNLDLTRLVHMIN